MGKTWISGRARTVTEDERLELDRFGDMGDRAMLTHEQEQAADIETLVRHNVKLAAHIALNYLDRGVPLADLLQAAWISVWKSAERYDGSVKFSTYATPAAHRACQREIVNMRSAIRIPASNIDGTKKTYTSTDPRHTKRVEKTRRAVEQVASVASLDGRINGGSHGPHVERGDSIDIDFFELEDNDTADIIMRQLDIEDAQQLAARALTALSSYERDVVEQYINMAGNTPRTLRDVADILGVSHETVRHRWKSAVKKMKEAIHDDMLD